MKNTLLLTFVLAFCCLQINAQIQVNNAITPQAAVNDVLIGTGIQPFNITFQGDNSQIGIFNSNGSNMPIGEGIVLGTGDVELASGVIMDANFNFANDENGGNNFDGSSLGGGVIGQSDPDLEEAFGDTYNDAAVLEFDFNATGDTVRFNYSFASEEYLEYVNSVNDVFGFFLTGPGINGGDPNVVSTVNIAVIPGTGDLVSINTVNHLVNTEFYVPNATYTLPPDAGFEPNSDPNVIEYDGFTVSLEARATILCDSTYHIKMAIADASDAIIDSGVFLEAGSFSSNVVQVIGSGTIEGDSTFAGDSIVVEGPNCNLAAFTFILPDSLETDTVVYFDILGTAINGVDYVEVPDSVIIPAGETEIVLEIDAIEDFQDEELESIIISYDFITQCGDVITEESSIYISDYTAPTVTIENQGANCPGDPVTISAETTGFGGFSYSWNDPENSTSQSVIWVVEESDTAIVQITDVCGITAIDSAIVTLLDYEDLSVMLSLDPEGPVECGEQVEITATVTGGGEPYQFDWLNAFPPDFLNPSVATGFIQGETEVSVTITDACDEVIDESILVTVVDYPELTVDITPNPEGALNCPGDPLTLTAEAAGGAGGYNYFWPNDFQFQSVVNLNPIESAPIPVEVTDACGTLVLGEYTPTFFDWPPIELTAVNDSSNCPGALQTLSVLASGGTENFTYDWFVVEDSNTIEVNPDITTNYTVTVNDDCTSETITLQAVVNIPSPLQITHDAVICVGTEGDIQVEGANGNYIYTALTTPDSLSVNAQGRFQGIVSGWYEIAVSEECAWVSPQIVEVLVEGCDTSIPNVFTPDADGSDQSSQTTWNGLNERFHIIGLEGFGCCRLNIFNRWGVPVYESNCYNNSWDGTINGKPVDEGVYFYIFTRSDGEETTGTITILRDE